MAHQASDDAPGVDHLRTKVRIERRVRVRSTRQTRRNGVTLKGAGLTRLETGQSVDGKPEVTPDSLTASQTRRRAEHKAERAEHKADSTEGGPFGGGT